MDSLIERLHASETEGEPLGRGVRSPEDEEGEYFRENVLDTIAQLIPNDITRQNQLDSLMTEAMQAKGRQEYRRGIQFAVRFMSEAMQPPAKTYRDFSDTYDILMKGNS